MGGIKAQLEKELREVALWLIPAVKDNMMELRSDEQYADFLAEKFDEGEYQYVGATVIQLEKKQMKMPKGGKRGKHEKTSKQYGLVSYFMEQANTMPLARNSGMKDGANKNWGATFRGCAFFCV